ncbi:MAG: hypothetical protein ACPLZG_10995 [Thermoproteota archaeon]
MRKVSVIVGVVVLSIVYFALKNALFAFLVALITAFITERISFAPSVRIAGSEMFANQEWNFYGSDEEQSSVSVSISNPIVVKNAKEIAKKVAEALGEEASELKKILEGAPEVDFVYGYDFSSIKPQEVGVIYIRNGNSVTEVRAERTALAPNLLSAISPVAYDIFVPSLVYAGNIEYETPEGELVSTMPTYVAFHKYPPTTVELEAVRSYSNAVVAVLGIVRSLNEKLRMMAIKLEEKEVEASTMKALKNELSRTIAQAQVLSSTFSKAKPQTIEDILAEVTPKKEEEVERIPSIYLFMLAGALVGAFLGSLYYANWQMTANQAVTLLSIAGALVGAVVNYVLRRAT